MPQRILAAARAAFVLRKAELAAYGSVFETGAALLDADLPLAAVLRPAKVVRPARFLRALAAALRRATAADDLTERSACWSRATMPVERRQGRQRRVTRPARRRGRLVATGASSRRVSLMAANSRAEAIERRTYRQKWPSRR